ncbi:MAG: glycosyltransferase, partial [Pseudomonadota bacterium]
MLVDITAHESAKRAAVAKYVSQLSIQPYDAVIFSLNHYRTYTLPASVKYAEAFCILDAETLKEPERIVEAELLRQERLGLVTVGMPEGLGSSRSGSAVGIPADSVTSIDYDSGGSSDRVLPLWQGPKPLVSVLCRSTNRAELPEALRSIAMQSYENIEVVLVDALGNGLSLSNSGGLQAPVKLVSTGSKLARPRAANAALDNATGEYLIFLDEDDWFDNDHIERLLMALIKNKDVGVAYSNTRKAHLDGTPVNEVFDFDFDPLLLKRDNYIPIHSALFTRKLLDAGCRFDESLPVYEDWDFWLQCAQHTVFIHVPVVSAHYRMGGQSATALASENLKYVADSAIFNARAKLFQKWLHKWSGQDLNTVLGTMDKSRDLNKLSREISAKNTHIDELTQQIHIAKESIATLENRLGELVQEVHDLNHARDLLAEELHQQRLTLEYRIRSLETEQQILLGSLSWRITKPLREGKKFLSERVLSPIRKMFHKYSVTRSKQQYSNGFSRDMTTNRSFSSTTQGLPSCTVIIPTRNQLALLKRCIEGVLSSQYDGELEIIIVDNQSDDRRTLSYLDSILANARVRVIPWNEPFNFSRINNMAASQAKGEVLCFLNNDIEILSPQWLEQLVSIAHEEGVGAVGATLLYPDRSVQHAGVALDEDWIGLHIAQHQTFTTLAEQYQLNRLYPMNAVTAACMVTKASTFQKLGGFNEKDLQVSFNDVDYCLRLQELGLPVLLYPGVQLLHHESATRKSDDLPENRPRAMREKEFMRTRWGNILQEKHYTGDIPFSQIMAEDRPALFDIESLRVQIARERAKLLSTPLQSSVASKSSLKVDETDIDSWEDKYRLLELEYRALESYTRSIKSELDLILASRSWRLTSGLRTFVRWATDTKHRLGRLVVSHPAGRGLYELLRGKRAPTQQEQSTPHSTNDFKENFFKQAAAGFEKFLASNELLEFPNGETPQVSIILIFYNQAPLSLLCLRSIIEKSDVPIELVIIDNASSDKTDQLLSRCRNARIVRNKDNKGFVEAVNQGAALCNGKHILLLNNDAMLQDHSLSRAVQTLESEPDAGAVGAKIVLLDGTLQEAGSIIWQDA